MLDRLDTVDWSRVHHAYGPATDTPDALRALLDGDPERRRRAHRHLFSTLLDDGLRNHATAVAAPFLVELVVDPRTPDRAALLGMLTCSVAGPFSVASPPILDDGGPDVHPILRDIYQAAEVAVPHCLQWVESDDERLSVAAVYFLASMWRRADEIVPALHARLIRSPGPVVRAILAFALGRLRPDDPRLAGLHTDDPDPAVRVIAAVGLLRGVGEVPELALATILAALADPDAVPGLEGVPCVELGVADLGRVLCNLPPALGARAVPPLCAALQRTHGFAVLGLVEPLLHFTFGSAEPAARDPNTLTLEQRRALTAMLENQALWHLGDRHFLLREYHLPTTRAAMAASLGVPEP
ncbi:HEAT repeat domain-containing protein [Nannocystis punicea]|uniref:HEAT repeat domain-containing protein n=1 Tax=Nannocystis punicea TaxID=2995304 RepID=A0ABY7H7C9_9BACT|nr:HEAT repeat domain-containing protein [Nannocystis poenicansa]WAS95171.1 HEAT repeat domain-containing protein [Nannocystis poenicansa]